MTTSGDSSLPNLLFVTIDQWRADSFGAAGHPVVRTPNLDALAADGVRFASHYSQASPCGPSRACLLTGTYQHTNRVVFNGTPLDAGLTNIAHEVRAGGYDPLLFGYTDQTVDPRTVADDDPRLLTYEGILPGFTVALQLLDDREAWYLWLEERGHDISDRGRLNRPRDDVEIPPGRGSMWPPSVFAADETETAFVVDRVIEVLDGLPEPWFVHVSLLRPHPPFHVPAPYNDFHDPAEVPAPLPAQDIDHPFIEALGAWGFTTASSDPLEVRQLRATYHGMIAEVDHQVGRLLGAVEAAGSTDRTVVAVTSDHGELLGDYGLVSKLGHHDHSFHVPLIVRWPDLGGVSGTVVDDFTEHVDVMPTLLDLAGLPVPEQCQGRSLRPFLETGSAPHWRSAAHWEFDFRVFAGIFGLPLVDCNLAVLRDRAGKLVLFGGLPPLYVDLERDPDEVAPVAEHPAMRTYAEDLLDWRPGVVDGPLANLLATPGGMLTLTDPGA